MLYNFNYCALYNKDGSKLRGELKETKYGSANMQKVPSLILDASASLRIEMSLSCCLAERAPGLTMLHRF